jgi:prepilin-type N-terminal cleavage/methylation domain-containing protein
VKTSKVLGMPAIPRRSSQLGFSMVELVMVVAVTCIIAAVTVVQLQPSLQNFRATAALGEVKSTLRQAREYAISQRRTVAVSFTTDQEGNEEIKLNLYNVAAGIQALNNVPFLQVSLEPSVQFVLTPTLPDTPDKFGNAAALCFNGAAYAAGSVLEFQSDGTFTDATGAPINGSIFLAIANNHTTARAVTILGSTGRVKGWSGADGASWFEQ